MHARAVRAMRRAMPFGKRYGGFLATNIGYNCAGRSIKKLSCDT